MGGSSSKHDNEGSAAQEGRKSARIGTKTFYAEIITDKALPADVPPIKVLINEQLAATAVDTIRDSQALAHELSKKLVVDYLTNKNSSEHVGIVLKVATSYESILKPTRDLIYWSLQFPCSIDPIATNAKSIINYIPVETVSILAQDWLKHPVTKKDIIVPLLTWTFQQPDVSVEPLRDVMVDWLPTSKELIKGTLKTSLLDALKSEETKDLVRDSIVGYLSKDDPNSTAIE
eukprot:gene32744-39584_t